MVNSFSEPSLNEAVYALYKISTIPEHEKGVYHSLDKLHKFFPVLSLEELVMGIIENEELAGFISFYKLVPVECDRTLPVKIPPALVKMNVGILKTLVFEEDTIRAEAHHETVFCIGEPHSEEPYYNVIRYKRKHMDSVFMASMFLLVVMVFLTLSGVVSAISSLVGG